MITPALSNCKTDTSCELPRCNTENPVHLAQFYSFNINCIIDGLKETKEIVVSAESLTTENVNELIENLTTIQETFTNYIDNYIQKFLEDEELLAANITELKSQLNSEASNINKLKDLYSSIRTKTPINLSEDERVTYVKSKDIFLVILKNIADGFEELVTHFSSQSANNNSAANNNTAANNNSADNNNSAANNNSRAPAPPPGGLDSMSNSRAPAPPPGGLDSMSNSRAPAPPPGGLDSMSNSFAPAPPPGGQDSMSNSFSPAPPPGGLDISSFAPAPGPSYGHSQHSNLEPSISPDIDHTSYGLLHANLTSRIEKALGAHLGVMVKPTFREELGKLIIFIKSIDYSSLTADKKLNLERIIQKETHDFLLLKFRNTGDSKYQVDLSRINVVAMSGSTYLVIQIMPKTVKHSLSDTDKEMLEFYNFMSVLQRGQVPIRENDYLNFHYPFNR